MSSKQDFTEQEWEQIIAGPPGAGMLVITAQRGGMFKETLSMAKAYAEARQQHGQSELLDEIVGTKPKLDHSRYHSPEELRDHVLSVLGEARSLLAAKGTPEELEQYRGFTVSLAHRVAAAHREGDGQDGVSEAEQAAIDSIEQALA
ncbi:MAG TPA: hypothetical protein VLZ06_09145 [Solirubrobacteraceae bacterium]|nr:hypothetical protein [Solirubrobacteraceae bacterium]